MQPPETAVGLQKRVGREFALLVGLVTIVLVFGLFAAYWASSHLGPEAERLHSFGEAGLVLVLAGVAIWFGRRRWRNIQRLQEDAELSLADMERARAQLQSFTRAAPAVIYHRVLTRGFPISWVSENSEPYFGYPASYLETSA